RIGETVVDGDFEVGVVAARDLELDQVERARRIDRVRRVRVTTRTLVVTGRVHELDTLGLRGPSQRKSHRARTDRNASLVVHELLSSGQPVAMPPAGAAIHQPLTPPAVNPETRYFCRNRNST